MMRISVLGDVILLDAKNHDVELEIKEHLSVRCSTEISFRKRKDYIMAEHTRANILACIELLCSMGIVDRQDYLKLL